MPSAPGKPYLVARLIPTVRESCILLQLIIKGTKLLSSIETENKDPALFIQSIPSFLRFRVPTKTVS